MNWKKIGNGLLKGAEIAEGMLMEKAEETEKMVISRLKTASDQQVLNGIRNGKTDYLKQLAKDEADSRGLQY